MALCNGNVRSSCTATATIASIIIGVLTAFLRLNGTITVPMVFLWVAFGIAIAYLAVALVASAIATDNEASGCRCVALTAVLVGILGTILTSVVLLAIEFVATSVIGAIVTGGLLFFFSLIVSATACLVKCFAGCTD